MPERKLERRPILDPAVADLLSDLEQKQAETKLPRREREKKVRERAKIQARREQRVTYDLPPHIRQNVKDLAEKEGVPASQLVTMALLHFLRDLAQQQVDLGQYKQPSRSPRYDWNLVLPDSLLPTSNRRSRKE